MKRIFITFIAFSMLLSAHPEKVQAQTLKDILNSETAQKVINVVKDMTAFKVEDLQGTWQYKEAACQFKSDELLQKAGGIALAESMETKLEAAYQKAGIKTGNFSYIFNSDSTFTCQIGKKELKGTYAYDTSTKILTLSYYRLLNSEVQLSKNSNGITFLFNADRLLKLVTLLSSYSKSSALSAVNKVAQQYDGMLIGFDLEK